MIKIIISAIGSDRSGIVAELTEIISAFSGNIEESKMTRLGSDFVMIILISIEEIKQDSLLESLQNIKGLSISTKETNSNAVITDKHCQIILNGADNEGIVNVLSKYLTNRSMNILDMETTISNAPITGTPLFNLITITSIPENINIEKIKSDLTGIAVNLGVEILVDQSEYLKQD